MATGQTLLDLCQVLDNELLLQSGEADVTRGLLALNAAQDLFEAVVSGYPDLYGDTVGTVAISSGTETTAFPSGLLRLDKMWMMENSRPLYPLDKVDLTGGQGYDRSSIVALITPQGTGRVTGYYTDGRSIYWAPFPSQSDTVRWYGFQAATDITANGTFLYPDMAMLPIASFATKLLRAGVGDDSVDLNEATATFKPVVDQLANFNRDRAPKLLYRYAHDT